MDAAPDALLGESFSHASGGALGVRVLAIDAGYNTSTVHLWVRRPTINRVIAVDGRDSYRRIAAELRRTDHAVNHKTVQRPMQALGLKGPRTSKEVPILRGA
jgi:phage terminase large subunit GpA-like protein